MRNLRDLVEENNNIGIRLVKSFLKGCVLGFMFSYVFNFNYAMENSYEFSKLYHAYNTWGWYSFKVPWFFISIIAPMTLGVGAMFASYTAIMEVLRH